MTTSKERIKVLLYGNVFRDYRSKLLVKILIDCGYHLIIVCPDLYVNKYFPLFKFLYLPELFFKVVFSDVIYLPPMNTRFIKSATWIAKIFRKKLVTEMYISLYDTYVRDRKLLKGKQIEVNSYQAKAMRFHDRFALKYSDYIIHTATHELQYWEEILDVQIDSKKIFIAPNCNTSKLIYKKNYEVEKAFKICWWGTFIPLHGLENILQAMKILQSKRFNFTCNLFGVDNGLFNYYQEKINQENLAEYVVLRKDLNFADTSLPKYLINHCDLALGIFGNNGKANNTIPNKLIESLSMGIPTLTMNSPALKEFFEPKTDLWTCNPDPESIAESIFSIANNEVNAIDWVQTRQKVLDTFSFDRYQEVVSQVIEKAQNDFMGKEIIDVQSNTKVYEQKVG